MTDVFISYSRKDGEFVEELYKNLKSENLEVWKDQYKITEGSKWWTEITTGIHQTDNVLFILSENSLGSVVCHFEIAHARKNNKRVIPVIYKPVSEEEVQKLFKALSQQQLSDFHQTFLQGDEFSHLILENWILISSTNWIFFDPISGFTQLVSSLKKAFAFDEGYVHAHTRYLTLAGDWEVGGKNTSSLLRGTDLLEAEQWRENIEGKIPEISDLQIEYINASRKQQDLDNISNKRRQKRIRFLVVITFLVVLVSISFIYITRRLTNADNAYQTGFGLFSDSEYQAAQIWFQEAIAENIWGDPKHFYSLGRSYAMQGPLFYDLAESSFRESIGINARYTLSLLHLTFMLREQGRYDQALDILNRAKEAYAANTGNGSDELGNTGEYRFQIAEAGLLFAQGQYEDALNILLSPSLPSFDAREEEYFYLTAIYFSQNNTEQTCIYAELFFEAESIAHAFMLDERIDIVSEIYTKLNC